MTDLTPEDCAQIAAPYRNRGIAMLDLIERLEKAESGSQELDALVWDCAHEGVRVAEAVTTSLDAIVALIEKKLPGYGIDISIRKGEAAVEVWSLDDQSCVEAKTAPVALLRASRP